MTLKTLENYTSQVANIVKKTNYAQSLNSLKASWTTVRTYKNTQPQTPTSNQQINNAIIQAEAHKKAVIDAAQKIKLELTQLSNFPLKDSFDHFFGNPFIQFVSQISQANIESEFPKLSELNTQFQFLNQLGSTIKSLNIKLTTVNLDDNDLLEVTFAGAASIKTLKEFARQSDKWNQIFHLLSRVARETDTDVSIESVEKGSLVVMVGAVASLVIITCKAIDKIQDVMLKHIDIQKKTFELRKMQVDGFDDILKRLDEQAKINLTKESSSISDSLLTEYEWTDSDEFYNETKSATRKAIRSLISFMNKGGSVKGYLNDGDDKQKEIIKIVDQKNLQIKALQKQIAELTDGKQTHLIEYLTLEDDDEKNDLSSTSKT